MGTTEGMGTTCTKLLQIPLSWKPKRGPCRPLTLLEYERREAQMLGLAFLSCSETVAGIRNQASPHSFTCPWNALNPSAGTGLVP